MEREALFPEPMVYSFIKSVRVPIKEPSHEKQENICFSSTEPHMDKRLTNNGVRPGFPRGSFTTLQSVPQYHTTFSTITSTLALVDQNPISQRVL
jgi:hypothetical protein